MTSNGELQVRNVQDYDRTSTFRCVTKNILTFDEKTSPPAHIHVFGKSIFLDVLLDSMLATQLYLNSIKRETFVFIELVRLLWKIRLEFSNTK